MKNLFLLLLISVIANAQTNRYIYEYRVVQNGSPQTMYMVLDVNPKETKFYDYKFLESDSLTKKNPGHVFRTNSAADQVILRPRNSFANTAFHTNNRADYFALKSEDKLRWNLLPETKTVDGYKLQKATTTFGARKWTAWFAPQVDVQEGPYKFRGLPGLIFQIEDSDKNFSYTLVKNKKLPATFDTSNFVETYYGTKPVTVGFAQFVKIRLDDFNNPVENLAKIIKDGGKVNMNGEDITTVAQLDQKRKGIQESIRKYYSPIEKDKAIPYPK